MLARFSTHKFLIHLNVRRLITMAKEKDDNGCDRRAALGTLIAGGVVLPQQWKKPVIDSVVMPGHAVTSGTCSATVMYATLDEGGTLRVTAEASMSPGCVIPTSSGDSLSCEIIHEGSVIGDRFQTASGGECGDASAPTEGCMVSCSVAVGSANHSAMDSESVTMRFTYGGRCVCTAVGTITDPF